MKTLKKFFSSFFIFLALLIVLTYAFHYEHLFNAIRLTYLKGETSATIDDGVDFPSRNIDNETPQPWQKDSLYNKTILPKNIVENLKTTHSASFLVIKNGKLLHEEYFGEYNAKSKTNSFSVIA